MVDGRRLVSLSDSQLEIVLEYAAGVDWSQRKRYLVAIVTHLARSGEPDDQVVAAACREALVAEIIVDPGAGGGKDVTGAC